MKYNEKEWQLELWKVVIAGCYDRVEKGIATERDKIYIEAWEMAEDHLAEAPVVIDRPFFELMKEKWS
jgi:hypothetical protein